MEGNEMQLEWVGESSSLKSFVSLTVVSAQIEVVTFCYFKNLFIYLASKNRKLFIYYFLLEIETTSVECPDNTLGNKRASSESQSRLADRSHPVTCKVEHFLGPALMFMTSGYTFPLTVILLFQVTAVNFDKKQ